MRLKLTEIQYNLTLISCFNQEILITFYAYLQAYTVLPVELCKWHEMTSEYGSTKTTACLKVLSRLNPNKLKFRSRITDVHSHEVTHIAFEKGITF